MKYMKMIGLAAIAAMALMAFVASSASATTLFSGANVVKQGTKIEATLSGSAVLASGGTTLDTCTSGSVSGTTANETGAVIEGNATVTWGSAGTECTNTTDTLNGGKLTISWITGTSNGTVKSDSAEVTVFTLGVSCTYGTSATGTDLGELKGSTTGDATLEINTTVEKKAGSFICPSSPSWKATYKVTSPTPLHVTN